MSIKRCSKPFTQLTLDQWGMASPCGYITRFKGIDTKGLSLEEIWNHQHLVELRMQILRGDTCACDDQIKLLGCNSYPDEPGLKVKWEARQRLMPQRLDLRLNSRCNLRCQTCVDRSGPKGRYDSGFFWDEGPSKLFPGVKTIIISGGEPFIQKDTWRLIDEVGQVNRSCSWVFYTNGQWKWNADIRKRLDRLKRIMVNISMDSAQPDSYARIRKGGTWSLITRNIAAWKRYASSRPRTCKLQVSFLVSALNWRQVPEMHLFGLSEGLSVRYQLLQEPAQFSLLSLPARERAAAVKQLAQWARKIPRLRLIRWSNLG